MPYTLHTHSNCTKPLVGVVSPRQWSPAHPPTSVAIAGVALIPVLVSTITVVCPFWICPDLKRSSYAAAACAHVGSTYSPTLARFSVAALILVSEIRSAPPPDRMTAATTSASLTGLAIDVPSAPVLAGVFHPAAGASRPSSRPSAARTAVAIGLHRRGWATQSLGRSVISPARISCSGKWERKSSVIDGGNGNLWGQMACEACLAETQIAAEDVRTGACWNDHIVRGVEAEVLPNLVGEGLGALEEEGVPIVRRVEEALVALAAITSPSARITIS